MDEKDVKSWLTASDLEVPKLNLVKKYEVDEGVVIPEFPNYVIVQRRPIKFIGRENEEIFLTKVHPTIRDGKILYVGNINWGIAGENGLPTLGKVLAGKVLKPDGTSYMRYRRCLAKADISEKLVVISSDNLGTLCILGAFLTRKEK